MSLIRARNTVKDRLVRPPVVLYRHRGVSAQDVFLASYPRSGSTWLRFMIAEGLGHKPDFESIRAMIPPIGDHFQALLRLPNGGRLIKTHERRDLLHGRRCRRGIYLIRDGRDVAVSYHFWMQRRGMFSGPFSEFLRLFLMGRLDAYGPWETHVRTWLDSPLGPAGNLLMIRYEDMLKNAEAVLSQVFEFLGVSPDYTQLQRSVKAHGFNRMRRSSSESPTIRSRAVREDIPLVRRGTADEWKDRFGDAERALFAEYVGSPLLERFGYAPL